MPDKEWIKNTGRRQKREIRLPITACGRGIYHRVAVIKRVRPRTAARQVQNSQIEYGFRTRLEPGDGPLWSYSGYIPIFAMSVNVSSFRLLSVCPRQGLAGYGYLNFPIFDSDFLARRAC